MELKVLGCSGGEFPGYNLPGFLLDGTILFDAGSLTGVLGEDEQRRLSHIFITHAHLDHIRAIPFLADNFVFRDHGKAFSILGLPAVISNIREHLLNGVIWPDFTVLPEPENPVVRFIEIQAEEIVSIDGYRIMPIHVEHSVQSVGYLVEDSSGRSLFYTGDIGPSHDVWKKLGQKRISTLIIEVSFSNSMHEAALLTGHLTPRLLEEELAKIAIPPERVLITHPKPQFRSTIRQELSHLTRKDIRLLDDGEIISI